MNEALYTNANGLRLIQEFEGAPRLKARLCEGNSWELGYGITFDLNGNPFTAESTCSPDEADALFRNALQNVFEPGVRNLVTVPLNDNQFSGLVALAWNIGLANLAGSSVLRRVNENRMDDAAACFGMWIFATAGNGHKQAMRGLLRRRFAESCLFMGYDWTVACDDDAIALQREIPTTFPGTDRVIYKTAFKDVLSVAQRYPLASADELVLNTPAPPTTMRVPEAAGAGPLSSPSPSVVPPAPKVSPAPTPPSPAKKPEAINPAPPQSPRAPVPPPKLPDPPVPIGQQTSAVDAARKSEEWSHSAKSMIFSRRFWGLFLVVIGRVWMLKTGSNAVLGAVSDPLVMEMFSGFMVMMLGELVQRWGERKATRPLR